jgi:hypothetical protein
MNSSESTGEESLDERLARAEREIRQGQLEEKIRELGGFLPPRAEDEPANDLVIGFFERVVAWETAPRSTHRDWLARRGLRFMPPAELCGRALKRELWRLIEALAIARVFLYHTNHLSDAELYARLWSAVLAGECPDFARTVDDACHWDFADVGSGDEELWLRYHATPRERREWQEWFPDAVLPLRERARYRRDHRLPVRD